MATNDLNVSSVIAATGWTGATVANLTTSNDVRATDGVAGEIISAELDDAPGDFGTQNTITLHVEAHVVGTVTRAKTILVELLDSGDALLQSFTTGTLTGTDQTFNSSAFSRTDALSVINGYRLRCTVLEGGGMADSATVEIDRMWTTLDYNLAALFTPSTAAFRFYDDDAGESASTPLDAQDTNVSVEITGEDVIAQLRLRVDETAGEAGALTDDWRLQYNKNSVGWNDVTDVSSNVAAPGGVAAAHTDALDISADIVFPDGITFSADGTKLFVSDGSNNTIRRYPLSVVWDILSAGASDQSFDAGLRDVLTPRFRADTGAKLYMAQSSGFIDQWPLSTGWDLSTVGTRDGATFIDSALNGFALKSDGTKLYAFDSSALAEVLIQYPLSTAWDILTKGTAEATKSFAGVGSTPGKIDFSEDGARFFLGDQSANLIREYALSTPWDVTTIGAVVSILDVSAFETQISDVFIGNSGKSFFHTGNVNKNVDKWKLPKPNQFTNDGSVLVDGDITTNRATNGITDPGAGVFVAGEQETDNGLVEDRQLTASNFTEHVWGLRLIAADLADTDTLDFRLLLNGSPITAAVTPRITVSVVVSADLATGAFAFAGQTVTTSITLAADLAVGAFSFTGQTITAGAATDADLDAGSYAFAGQTLGSTVDRTADLALAALTFAGQTIDASRTIPADLDVGTFGFAGLDIDAGTGASADLATGSHVFAGQTINTAATFNADIAAGSFAFAGFSVSTGAALDADLATGTFAFAGLGLTSSIGNVADLAAGAFTLDGMSLATNATLGADLDVAAFTFAGLAIDAGAGASADLAAGSYGFAGQTITTSLVINADLATGGFVFAGLGIDDAAGPAADLATGSFALAGLAVSTSATLNVGLDAGTYTATGHDLDTSRAFPANLETGALVFSGRDLETLRTASADLAAGTFVFAGLDIDALGAGVVSPDILMTGNWRLPHAVVGTWRLPHQKTGVF